MLKPLFKTTNDVAPFILRVLLGAVFFSHGLQKVRGWFGGQGLSATADFLTPHLHIPILSAFLSIATEFIGSIALITGCFTRLAALGIATLMLVAIATVQWEHGIFMNWFGARKGGGIDYPVLAIGIALALFIKGGGKWALDIGLARLLGGESPAQNSRTELQAARNSGRSSQIVGNSFDRSLPHNDNYLFTPTVSGVWGLPNAIAHFRAIIDAQRRRRQEQKEKAPRTHRAVGV